MIGAWNNITSWRVNKQLLIFLCLHQCHGQGPGYERSRSASNMLNSNDNRIGASTLIPLWWQLLSLMITIDFNFLALETDGGICPRPLLTTGTVIY